MPFFKTAAFLKEKTRRANQVSHCYNHLPLLLTRPGGIQWELVVLACLFTAKVRRPHSIFNPFEKNFFYYLQKLDMSDTYSLVGE